MPNVLILNQQDECRVPRKYTKDCLQNIWVLLRKKKIISQKQKELDINVVFVTSDHIKSLNSSFRKKAKPTDVLSFSSSDPELLGELVLCPSVIEAQANSNGWPRKYEYLYMLVHGVLHLLGYDHETDKEEKLMFALQDEIFNSISDGPKV
jgi:probable rRNA maturation factor